MTSKTPETKISPIAWRSCLVFIAICVVLVAILFWVRGKGLPRLDRQSYEVARSLWEENRLNDYEITVAVTGRQPGNYFVRVRSGLAMESSMNGRGLTQPRTFGTWAVDGLFETLQRDLNSNEQLNNLMLGVEFDEDYGFPRRYERMEMQTGMHHSLQWEVTEFKSLSADETATP